VKLPLLAAAILLALLSLDVFRANVFSRIEATSTTDMSLAGRILLWVCAVKVAKANLLFGVGMENFRFVKDLYGFPGPLAAHSQYNAHSLYLELLADLGIVGLACFLWMLIGTFVRLDRVTARTISGDRGLAVGVNAALIAYAVHGVWDSLTWQHGAFVLLGVLIGLAMSLRRLSSEHQPSGVAPRMSALHELR
jgi:putative inorganic carbon (HCO3(-)) transporter